MEEIIKSVSAAEARGEEIKAEALKKADAISAAAAERAAEIEKLSETECKLYREKSISSAKISAEEKYNGEILKARADAARYAEDRLKNSDGCVEEIVRRITRGR